ncbi:hypothetical protein COB64_04045 [Candidatus Wolfebacteria bacterium]|nr:MAG: hypothetical protein COB64_04045 [Candidatus Wolfebacteria bacterium]
MNHEVCFFIDLDGVLVDNALFEDEVLEHIGKELALERKIDPDTGMEILRDQISKPVSGRNRYRYDFQCNKLGLGDEIWKAAHIANKNLLFLYPETIQFLKKLKKLGKLVIVSDTTRWVLDFKISVSGIGDLVDHTISQDNVSAYKGEKAYWDSAFRMVGVACENYDRLFYIENRVERIKKVKKWYPNLEFIHVLQTEHLTRDQSILIDSQDESIIRVENLNSALNAIKELMHSEVY